MARAVKTTKAVAKKPTVKKTAVIAAKKIVKQPVVKVAKTIVVKSPKTENISKLHAPVLTIEGKSAGTVALPEILFNAKINKHLVAQAVRVYLSNQREGSAKSKTRGEVQGSTRKIYKQKGTGRARHGGIRAPIFAGGGVAFGPRPHDFTMAFPQKMRRAALASILTSKLKQGDIIFIQGMDSILPKTKEMMKVLTAIGVVKGMIVVTPDSEPITRSARNIEGIKTIQAANLNTYAVLTSAKIVIPKNAIPVLEKTFIKSV
jgi:large subunit ribosomal protein L4